MRHFFSLVICVCLLSVALPVHAAYPEKTITVIVPFGAGSGADRTFRVCQPFFEKALGVKLMPDYKAGAGGIVGANYYMTTRPDGYTLLYYNFPHISIQQKLMKTSFNTSRLIPLYSGVSIAEILTVREDSPFKTMEDFVEYAKANPGKVTVGNTGSYSSNHLSFAIMSREAGIELARIPFENGNKMNMALLDGQIDAACSNSQWLTINKGKLRALGSFAPERTQADIPTFVEQGFPGMSGPGTGNMLLGLANMPEEARNYLITRLATLKDDQEFREALNRAGIESVMRGHDELVIMLESINAQVDEVTDLIRETAQ